MTVDSIRDFPAVELCLKLTTETLDDLTIEDSQALLIAELCRQLDGVPLAIELAAVRVRLLGCCNPPIPACHSMPAAPRTPCSLPERL